MTENHLEGLVAMMMPLMKSKGKRGIFSLISMAGYTLWAFMWWSECFWNLKMIRLSSSCFVEFQEDISRGWPSAVFRYWSPQCSMYSTSSIITILVQDVMLKNTALLAPLPSRSEKQSSPMLQERVASRQRAKVFLQQLQLNEQADLRTLARYEQQLWFLGEVTGSSGLPTFLWCRYRCSVGQTVNWKKQRSMQDRALNPNSCRCRSSWAASMDPPTMKVRARMPPMQFPYPSPMRVSQLNQNMPKMTGVMIQDKTQGPMTEACLLSCFEQVWSVVSVRGKQAPIDNTEPKPAATRSMS